MTKQKTINLAEQPPAAGVREIILPFTVSNRSFFRLCVNHLSRGRVVDYEGAAYWVEYARDEDTRFVIGLTPAEVR